MTNHILCEEETKSVLLPLHDITLLLFPMINRHKDLVSASLKHVYNFCVKTDQNNDAEIQ